MLALEVVTMDATIIGDPAHYHLHVASPLQSISSVVVNPSLINETLPCLHQLSHSHHSPLLAKFGTFKVELLPRQTYMNMETNEGLEKCLDLTLLILHMMKYIYLHSMNWHFLCMTKYK